MLQAIMGKARRAIDDYAMIDDGDKIAIGLSGGKDSLTLLHSLYYLKKYYPKKFDIMAITIHPGSETFDTTKLEELCKKLDIEYIVYHSDISKVVFDIRNEKNETNDSVSNFEEDEYYFERFMDKYGITQREGEILELLLQRKHNQEIANQLYLSLGTVKTHTHNIFIKLQVEKRSEVCEVWEAFEKSELTQ